MSRKAPIAVESTNLADHPAARAWNALGGVAPAKVELWRRARSKPAIYRLTFAKPRRPAVYAKQSLAADLAIERMVYQEILPRLPLTVPHYHGSCRDSDGSIWLFVESAGERRLSEKNSRHRALAARWLGLLHASAATEVAARRLPDAGPGRYLGHLRSGRAAILRNFGNPALAAGDRVALTGILQKLDTLESRWPRLERACEGLPVTLVHGDFRLKNVRVRGADAAAALYVLDWEMAGWGIPAADLACACGPGLTIRIDLNAYREAARDLWKDLDAAAICRLSILGRIFQALASTEWSGASLRFESDQHLLKPVGEMRIYRAQISRALEEGAEWLR